MMNQTTQLPLPPGSLGLPVLGETLDFLQSPTNFFAVRAQRHGEIFYSNVLGAKTVFMGTPEANQWIFAGENKYLVNQWSYAIRQLLGEKGVAMLTGEAHTKRRHLLAPHFKHSAMADFVADIQSVAEQHLQRWGAVGGITEVIERVRPMAFEIATHFIFGNVQIDIPYLSQLFTVWTGGMFDPLPMELPFTPFGKAMKAKRAMLAYLEPIVRERMKLAEQPFDILGSMLSLRDENGEALDLETVLHEVQVQLFAGHDTTVTATSNLIMLLAQHPAVVERLRAEQAQFPDPLKCDLELLQQMPYLSQVINEGLRLIPPVGGAFRVTTQEVEFNGYRIPKGWTILFSPGRTHILSPWTEPQKFDPERWNAERAEHKQKPFSFVAFGGGPRMCLGQNFALVEMRIILALLLRSYQWQLTPNQDLTPSPFPFPLPKNGIKVNFAKRS